MPRDGGSMCCRSPATSAGARVAMRWRLRHGRRASAVVASERPSRLGGFSGACARERIT